MYNEHLFNQIFEGKIRMCIIHGYNNSVYNVHNYMGVHYTWQNMVNEVTDGWVDEWWFPEKQIMFISLLRAPTGAYSSFF